MAGWFSTKNYIFPLCLNTCQSLVEGKLARKGVGGSKGCSSLLRTCVIRAELPVTVWYIYLRNTVKE